MQLKQKCETFAWIKFGGQQKFRTVKFSLFTIAIVNTFEYKHS